MSNLTENSTKIEEYNGTVQFEECSTQRGLGLLFSGIIAGGIIIQLALIHAILTSNFHRKNMCYQSILVIGIYNLVQLVAQEFVTVNLLACTNVGYYFNVVGGSLNNVSYYVIEPYGFVLAVNRLVIVIIRNKHIDKWANFTHKWINMSLWVIGIPPILMAFEKTCHINYRTYGYTRTSECIYDGFINGLFHKAYNFMEATFIVYVILVLGLVYQRTKMSERNRSLMSKTEWRILMTALSDFSGVLFVMILRTYFIDFISNTGQGRIIYRFTLIFCAFLNALLTFAFNKPLQNRIYDSFFLSGFNKRNSVITLASRDSHDSFKNPSNARRYSRQLSK